MITSQPVIDIAHIVQMAVAPVFLLTGVGAVLSVLTTRLSRVIDRGRQLDQWVREGHDPNEYALELKKLDRRNILINSAITLATFKITVRGRCTMLPGPQLVGIHCQAHRTTWLAPLQSRGDEDFIQAFRLRLRFHCTRTGNHYRFFY